MYLRRLLKFLIAIALALLAGYYFSVFFPHLSVLSTYIFMGICVALFYPLISILPAFSGLTIKKIIVSICLAAIVGFVIPIVPVEICEYQSIPSNPDAWGPPPPCYIVFAPPLLVGFMGTGVRETVYMLFSIPLSSNYGSEGLGFWAQLISSGNLILPTLVLEFVASYLLVSLYFKRKSRTIASTQSALR